jgi:hypothetical protein
MGHHLHPPRYSPCDAHLLDPFYQTRLVECTPSQRDQSLGRRMPNVARCSATDAWWMERRKVRRCRLQWQFTESAAASRLFT